MVLLPTLLSLQYSRYIYQQYACHAVRTYFQFVTNTFTVVTYPRSKSVDSVFVCCMWPNCCVVVFCVFWYFCVVRLLYHHVLGYALMYINISGLSSCVVVWLLVLSCSDALCCCVAMLLCCHVMLRGVLRRTINVLAGVSSRNQGSLLTCYITMETHAVNISLSGPGCVQSLDIKLAINRFCLVISSIPDDISLCMTDIDSGQQ